MRWGRGRKVREVLVPLGLNLGALAFLGAILASGTEPGGLGLRWEAWWVPSALALVLGTLAFRFPRAFGLPLLVLTLAGTWALVGALAPFAPLGPGWTAPVVQPLTDRETVTAFAWRVDRIDLPEALPLAEHQLYRVRAGDTDPPEPWWSWVQARGWARTEGAPIPERPLKYGVYRLTLAGEGPRWALVKPDLSVPGE